MVKSRASYGVSRHSCRRLDDSSLCCLVRKAGEKTLRKTHQSLAFLTNQSAIADRVMMEANRICSNQSKVRF